VGKKDISEIDLEIARITEDLSILSSIEASVGESIGRLHERWRDAKALKDWPEAKGIMAEMIDKSPRTIERMEQNARDVAAAKQLEEKLMILHGFDPESLEGEKLREKINHRSAGAGCDKSKDDPISQRIRREILEGTS
jgi:uncharacterized protein YqeY